MKQYICLFNIYIHFENIYQKTQVSLVQNQLVLVRDLNLVGTAYLGTAYPGTGT